MRRNSLLLFCLLFCCTHQSLFSQTNSIFEDYPWLTTLVNPTACTNESVAVYDAGGNDFLLVTDETGSQKLYLDNGTFYCQNSANYDCVAAYNLSSPIADWACNNSTPTMPTGDGEGASDAAIFTDYPWLSPLINTNDCGTASVTEYASGAYTFLLLDNGNGLQQLYFENGTLYCTNSTNYNCVVAYNLTEALRTWSCGDMATDNPTSDTGTSSTINDPLFTLFPWLGDLIGESCTSEAITVYQQGAYQYLSITDASGGNRLYFEDGRLYCQSGPGLDCVAAYNLNQSVYDWTCGKDNAQPDCNRYTGTIVFANCDDGRLFNYIRTADGQLLDIYFPFGNTYPLIEGQSVKFDYQEATFASPCSIATKAVNITCITTNNEDPNAGDCNKHTGTFFFRNCDDGTPYVFIQSTDGTVYDPYFDGNISYAPTQGQMVKFDFKSTDFTTPCSIADQAITITCLEPITPDYPVGNCENNRGELRLTTCADGSPYFLIYTTNGQVLDPYYAAGVNFSEADGQTVLFDYVEAGFPSGCDLASKAITITCIVEILPESFTNDVPDDFEDYDVIYRICRGETLRIENMVRSIQCDCPPNPQGPCDNFPFNQWGIWEGSALVDNVTHVLVSPTTTTAYENQINGYFCGIQGPTFGPTNTINYLVIVEASQDCALPIASAQTEFDVSGCVGDVVRVPAPNPGNCPLGPPIQANGVVEVLQIDANFLEVRLLQNGSFTYGIAEEQDLNGVTCPTATYQYNVQTNNCANSSFPVTKVFDYSVCIGEELLLIRPNPGNCGYGPLPNSNDYMEVLGETNNLIKVKVLQAGSFRMSNSENTNSFSCPIVIHDVNFSTHVNCVESNLTIPSSHITSHFVADVTFGAYPNPSSGQLFVPVKGMQQVAQQLRIFDVHGRTIQELSIPSSSGTTTLSLDLTNEENGIYFIELRSGDQREVQRVLKQG